MTRSAAETGVASPNRSAARTATLVAADLASVWHPFTQHSVWPDSPPLVIERGQGRYLYDVEGCRYLDGISSLWVTVHGHREPEIDVAIRSQLGRVAHSTFLGLTHEPGIALAEALLQTAPPGLRRVFYAGDGSSAVEAALKMAYQSARQRGEDRPLFVHVAEGYHGDTLGAVSVGGIDLFFSTYRPILLETRQVGSPGVRAGGQSLEQRAGEVLTELSALLEVDGERVCAVVVEPMVQAAGGMLTHSADFLRGVRTRCDASGALLVADEVATGFGRTGRMWAVEHAGVAPDLLTCGKGLTGGYLPLSAVLTTDAVHSTFLGTPASARTFFHGHSYTANPLACAAALANLRLMAERDTVSRAAAIGAQLGELLAPLVELDGVAEVRRLGTMTGIELSGAHGAAQAMAACAAARAGGVLLRPLGNVVVLMPMLGSEPAEVEQLGSVAATAVAAALGAGP